MRDAARLRLLGGLDFWAVDGGRATALAAQPKRAALLLALALAEPEHLWRRDQLVALLWPEMPDDRARAALRRGLSHLRATLGAEAVRTVGDELVGLDPARCASDVWTFRAHVAAGRAESALAAYGGPLAPGFHLDDAPEWERHLEEHRLRLHRTAVKCADDVARLALADGDLERAERWSRWSCEQDPGDEGACRTLLRVLVARGDAAAALREFERFAAWLRTELDSSPGPETLALAARARRGEQDGSASVAPSVAAAASLAPPAATSEAARAAAAPGSDDVRPVSRDADGRALAAAAAGPLDASGGPARDAMAAAGAEAASQADPASARRVDDRIAWTATDFVPASRSWRDGGATKRSQWFARAAGIALAALLPATVWLAARARRNGSEAPPAASAVSPDGIRPAGDTPRLAILPFALRGPETLAYLKEGVVELLAVQLDATGAVRLAGERGHARGAAVRDSGLDPRAVARRAGAERYVVGTIVATPDRRLQLVAVVHDSSGAERARLSSGVVPERELFSAVDTLARQLVALEAGARLGRLGRLAALTSGSLPAIRSYLRGERAFAAGRFEDAAGGFAEAVVDDSSFALAWFRLSVAIEWGGGMRPDWTAPQAAARADRLADRLPRRERLLLHAYLERQAGRVATADAALRRITTEFPDALEGWHEWGELRFHSAHELGLPMRSARPMFDRALALDPGNVSVRVHLARLAGLERRPATVDSLVAWVEGARPDHESLLDLRLLRAALRDDRASLAGLSRAAARAVAPLDAAGENRLLVAAWRVAQFAEDPGAALPLLRALDDPRRGAETRLSTRLAGAAVEAGRGRWAAVDSALRAAAALDAGMAAEERAMLAALVAPAGALDPGAAAVASAGGATEPWPTDVGGAAAGAAGASFPAFRHQVALRPALRPVLEGLLAVRGGDPARAARAVDAARRAAATLPAPYDAQGRALALELEGAAAAASGDAAGARRALDGAWRAAVRLPSLFAYPLPARLLVRARAALVGGDAAEALRWCEAAESEVGLGEAFAGLVQLCRAELRGAVRDASGAAAARARLAGVWREADAASRRRAAAGSPRPAARAGDGGAGGGDGPLFAVRAGGARVVAGVGPAAGISSSAH